MFAEETYFSDKFNLSNFERDEVLNICSKDNCKDIYELALRYQNNRRYDISYELLKKAMQLANLKDDIFYANKILNEIEIREKKIALKSKPRAIHVTLTDRCNMACQFCYQKQFLERQDLSQVACEEIMGFFPYLQRIIWQGGESFLHPYFKEMLMESLRFPNIQQALLTNGIFLDEKWLEIFLKIPEFQLVIPVESLNKETYEDLRRGGSFNRLIHNIKLVNEMRENSNNKLELSVNIIIMRRNYLELEDIVDFAIENKFFHIILTPIYPMGSKFYEKEYISPNDNEVSQYFSKVMPKILDKAYKNKIYLDDRFSLIPTKQDISNGQVSDGDFLDSAICLTPWQQLFIEVNGEVKNYCHCSYSIGNLKRDSLKEIWNNGPIAKMRENILNNNYSLCNTICVEGVLDKSNLRLS